MTFGLAPCVRHRRGLAAALCIAAGICLQPTPSRAASVIDGTYFQSVQMKGCHTIVCKKRFLQIPDDKVLVLRRVSCHITLESTAKISFVKILAIVYDSGDYVPGPDLPVYRGASVNGRRNYFINAELNFTFGRDQPGGELRLRLVRAAPASYISCTVHGTLSDAPPPP